jgi:hypothetical protein
VWRGAGGAGAGTGFEFPLTALGVALLGAEFEFTSAFGSLGAAGDPGVDERVRPGMASAA